MKKTNNGSRVDDLMIDVIEYAFIEWLVRQGVFAAFKANYESAFSEFGSFRNRLRAHIRFALRSSSYKLGDLISSAFMFDSTPEGVSFWCDKSAAWSRFCLNLKTKF